MNLKKATDIFGQWAAEGKDIGMEKTHANPVNEMIDYALKERAKIGKNFSFLDLGCGNGDALLALAPTNTQLIGIDISEEMLSIAKERTKAYQKLLKEIIN